uniref:Ribonuclease A-domain domain-containing protein n=1 Tax=Oryzias melastigma TaxID=30732 RepID=A0A3B3BKM2_ORYME
MDHFVFPQKRSFLIIILPVPIEPPKLSMRYKKFHMQHIDNKVIKKGCDSVIGRKNIYNNDNSCKEVNTFILGDPVKVKNICKGEGTPKGTLTLSRGKFRIIKCTLKSGVRKPNCQYNGKLLTERNLLVNCENKLPVHFQDSLI